MINKINKTEYKKVLKECEQISFRKNKDYGTEPLLRFGSKGLLMRISDKYFRIENLLMNNKKEQIKEKKEDTLKDMINYCVYLIMVERGKLV